MDLNGDGRQDILSGSYSGKVKPMAGLFQVLWGAEGGGFQKPEPLKGTDEKLLVIPGDNKNITRRICTRPFAVDWDGDGDLDIVTGNFDGGFFLFRGEGKGRFQPVPEALKTGDKELKLGAHRHGDPFVVDWDGDGDLDILSGSSSGIVWWAENEAGTGKEPKLKGFVTLIPAAKRSVAKPVFEKKVPEKPSGNTRIWVDDINGDGKLDILMGDCATIAYAAKGIEKDAFQKKLADWDRRTTALMKKINSNPNARMDRKLMDQRRNHYQERSRFLTEERTGFVWLFLRK